MCYSCFYWIIRCLISIYQFTICHRRSNDDSSYISVVCYHFLGSIDLDDFGCIYCAISFLGIGLSEYHSMIARYNTSSRSLCLGIRGTYAYRGRLGKSVIRGTI